MVLSGRMHGYVRMYWAKKVLEWSPTAEDAFNLCVEFNDRYQLDGRDPNGYTGVAWAIGGRHDRPWSPRRNAFGTIRYMSLASTGKKFNLKGYVARVAALEKGAR
jgi:deoxyribodipyrimidine photo-lyase